MRSQYYFICDPDMTLDVVMMSNSNNKSTNIVFLKLIKVAWSDDIKIFQN